MVPVCSGRLTRVVVDLESSTGATVAWLDLGVQLTQRAENAAMRDQS